MRDILCLSLGFFLIYSAYNGAQTFVAALFGSSGATDLAYVYLSFCFSSMFLASRLVARFGARNVLFLTGVGFAPFILGQTTRQTTAARIVTPICSCLCGLSAGTLWMSQGTYLSLISTTSNAGKYTGIFLMFFQASNMLGNVLASLIMPIAPLEVLFVLFALLVIAGASLFLYLPDDRNFVAVVAEKSSASPPTASTSALLRYATTDCKARPFVPLLVWSGMSISYFFTFFPARIAVPAVGADDVGYVMVYVGIADTAMSFAFGVLADRADSSPWAPQIMLTSTVVAITLASVLLTHLKHRLMFSHLCMIGLLLGTADAAATTFIFYHACTAMRDAGSLPFVLIPVVQGAVAGVCMLCVPRVPSDAALIVVVVLATCGTLPYLPKTEVMPTSKTVASRRRGANNSNSYNKTSPLMLSPLQQPQQQQQQQQQHTMVPIMSGGGEGGIPALLIV